MLGRDQLLGKATLKRSSVEIELGEVGIRELNGREREEVLEMFVGSTAAITPGMQAKLARWCVVDENLDPVFQDGDEDQINAMSGRSLETISLAVLRLSGLTEDSAEDLEKNLPGEPSVGSGSGSPRLSAAQ